MAAFAALSTWSWSLREACASNEDSDFAEAAMIHVSVYSDVHQRALEAVNGGCGGHSAGARGMMEVGCLHVGGSPKLP